MSLGREFDVVLFGATGFTGALTAEYLAAQRHARTPLSRACLPTGSSTIPTVRDTPAAPPDRS
jgi:short subunit dehydrogenase-like uncharacterized protein